jgi:subfamily B ATP-binding cassette protein MsbA
VKSRLALPLFRMDPRIAADLRAQRRPITLGLVCTGLAALLYTSTIALVKLTTQAIEAIGATSNADRIHAELGRLGWACAAAVAIFGLRYFLVRGQIYFLAEASNRLAADLRRKLFSKLLRLPVSYFNERRTGTIQSILTNDVNAYQNAIGIIRDSIDGPIKAVGAFVAILFLQPALALIAFLLIPVMAWTLSGNSRKMRVAQTRVQEGLADLSATTQEVLGGTRVVKAFGVEEQTEREYGRLIEDSFSAQMRAASVFARLRPFVEFVGALALVAILYVSGLLAAGGRLHVSDITAIALAMDTINQGFRNLASLSNTMAGVQASSDRIWREILEVPEEPIREDGKLTLPSPRGDIEFSEVSFVYPDGTRALDQVSFRIPAGESLALVGPSGAGKSTIADLLLRFYEPSSGRITIDGVDVRQLSIESVRALIGVVPQATFLFADTIEENVRLGSESASDAEVRAALEAAHATEFANEMKGRATQALGERGTKLSGGQMQRVAIARALIRKPTILLLDEATSALDATSERAVSEALFEIMRGRTTLMIAHRLTTAARADRLLYLKAGRVVESGSHAELMAADGEYAALFRVFSSGVMGGELG